MEEEKFGLLSPLTTYPMDQRHHFKKPYVGSVDSID